MTLSLKRRAPLITLRIVRCLWRALAFKAKVRLFFNGRAG